MNTEALFKLLSDDVNSDFVVIGVIGRQSVGKSTLLNAIAGHTTVKPFNAPSDGSRKKPPFKVATANTMLLAQHQTHGVDAYVTSERHILLDCEPIDSASVLTRMLRLETPLLPEVKSHEAMAYLIGLRTCIWLMSVCNVILVVDDGLGITSILSLRIFRSCMLAVVPLLSSLRLFMF
jgi:protein SMG9